MKLTHPITVSLLLAGALLTPGCVISTDDDFDDDFDEDFDEDVDDGDLLVVNDSDFVIEQVFITDVNASGWGPNLLFGDVLFPGESIVIPNLGCNVFDALVVDETGLECELLGVDLCFDDATWLITNDTCDLFAAMAARSEQR